MKALRKSGSKTVNKNSENQKKSNPVVSFRPNTDAQKIIEAARTAGLSPTELLNECLEQYGHAYFDTLEARARTALKTLEKLRAEASSRAPKKQTAASKSS